MASDQAVCGPMSARPTRELWIIQFSHLFQFEGGAHSAYPAAFGKYASAAIPVLGHTTLIGCRVPAEYGIYVHTDKVALILWRTTHSRHRQGGA